MTSYEVFAPFYDAVQGDRAEHVTYLRELIEKHHPTARTVLELACGTGSILEQLQPHYEVTGLDLSEPMLARAAEKVPGVRLIHGDMTQFSLSERFDVVLCVYDSINHLLNFAQWEELFDRAREHLNDRGIFIFDINTELALASYIEQPPWTHWFGDAHLLVMDVRDDGKGLAVWDIRVFEHLGNSRYRLHAEGIHEVSFPRTQIEKSLRERFTRISTHDRQRARPTSRSERLHFVCQN
jgi:predicted TPR repeat methyltransferase